LSLKMLSDVTNVTFAIMKHFPQSPVENLLGESRVKFTRDLSCADPAREGAGIEAVS